MGRFRSAVVWTGLLLLCGCATTTERQATVLYEPSVNATGAGGDLVINLDTRPIDARKGPWVIGDVRNNHRDKVGNVISDISPDELILNAFASELRKAGYRVVQVPEITPKAAMGVRLSDVKVTVDEVDGLFAAETHTTMKVAVELWRGGVMLKRMDYETDHSNSAVTNRSRLAADSLRDSLTTFLKQAVPAIVKNLEQ